VTPPAGLSHAVGVLVEFLRATFHGRQTADAKFRPKPIRSRKHISISLLSKLMQQARFVLISLGEREATVFDRSSGAA
jgi:hypothetical protein